MLWHGYTTSPHDATSPVKEQEGKLVGIPLMHWPAIILMCSLDELLSAYCAHTLIVQKDAPSFIHLLCTCVNEHENFPHYLKQISRWYGRVCAEDSQNHNWNVPPAKLGGCFRASRFPQ